MLRITEIFRHRKPRKRNAHTHAGRLVHLPEHERGSVSHAALVHFAPEVVALAAALADTRENGITSVLGGNVVYELLYQNCLADACSAEKTDLSSARIRLEQVYDLYARFKHAGGRHKLGKCRRFSVYLPPLGVGGKVISAVYRLSEDVEHTPERASADGNVYPLAESAHFHTARQSL